MSIHFHLQALCQRDCPAVEHSTIEITPSSPFPHLVSCPDYFSPSVKKCSLGTRLSNIPSSQISPFSQHPLHPHPLTLITSFPLMTTEMDLGLISQWMSRDLVPTGASTSMWTSSMVCPHCPQATRQYTTPERSSKSDMPNRSGEFSMPNSGTYVYY